MADLDDRVTRPCFEPRFGIRTFRTVSRDLGGNGPVEMLWDFHRGEAVTAEVLNEQLGGILHVDWILQPALQYIDQYYKACIWKIRIDELKKRRLAVKATYGDGPLIDEIEDEINVARREYYCSLSLICNDEIKPELIVAAIFRMMLTMCLVDTSQPTATAVLFSNHPNAVNYVEDFYDIREKYNALIPLGKEYWAKTGEQLKAAYAEAWSETIQPNGRIMPHIASDI